jgi:hypothetical protein
MKHDIPVRVIPGVANKSRATRGLCARMESLSKTEWFSPVGEIIFLGAAVACGALLAGCEAQALPEATGQSASASTETVATQSCFQIQIGVTNCDCGMDFDNTLEVNCICDPLYGTKCVTIEGSEEVRTTPTVVNRFVDPATGLHYYTTDSTAPSGYSFQEHAFALANDDHYGAIPFLYLNSGEGFYFKTATAIPDLVPLYGYYNPFLGDRFFTTNQNDVKKFKCVPAHCDIDPMTGVCTVVDPDCYVNVGFVGFVGSQVD